MSMIRDTTQRRAIRQVLKDADRPLSPQEVLESAQAEISGLGIATVYRTINSLVSEGWLVPIDLPGDTTRYELSGKEHHHHFCCRKCGQVFEIEGCAFHLDQHLPPGFRLESHEVVLYGLCAQCGKGAE